MDPLTDVTLQYVAAPEAFSCCNKLEVEEVDKVVISLLVTLNLLLMQSVWSLLFEFYKTEHGH